MKHTGKDEIKIKGEDIIIIDPCYVVKDEEWGDAVDGFYEGGLGECREGVYEHNGVEILVTPTAHGDGSYPVKFNSVEIGKSGVDAGLLSVIRVKDFKKINPDFTDEAFGTIVPNFYGIVTTDDYKIVSEAGNLVVDTNDFEEEELDEWDSREFDGFWDEEEDE